jgi:hypothetical protein
MGAHEAFQQEFTHPRMMMTERGLVLGGVVLAKMRDRGVCFDGKEERVLTLLAIACRGGVPGMLIESLRRVSKH